MNEQTDSIVRYCKPTQVLDGTVLAVAFYLRKKDLKFNRPEDEKELSVFHYEHFKNNPLKELKNHCQKNGLNLNKNGYFAVIKYSNVKNDIKKRYSHEINIIPDKTPHYLIQNLYQCNNEIYDCFVDNIDSVTQITELD